MQPFILKLRLAYRDIIIQEKLSGSPGWDKPLPDKIRLSWLNLAKEMYGLENISFPRSLVPEGYDPDTDPLLLLAHDGSDLGQCVVTYLVWTMLDGSIKIRLVTSRVKIASLKKITTVISELLGAILGTRLKVWLLDTMKIKVRKVIHIIDSSIVLGMIKNVSLKFDTFTAPRIAEIQANMGDASWYWVNTDENIADLGTRGKVSPLDLGKGSRWQEGPSWLKEPFEKWPIRQDFKKHELPGL